MEERWDTELQGVFLLRYTAPSVVLCATYAASPLVSLILGWTEVWPMREQMTLQRIQKTHGTQSCDKPHYSDDRDVHDCEGR